jgi:basic amino acid/polyamine antiporter, APA family
VALGVLILRVKQPHRPRSFRTPFAWIVCPLAVLGCLLLFLNLSKVTMYVFFGWAAVGLVVYYLYGYRKSHLANGTEPV